ncbi:carboxymuconolactone decarboxylase family protein [Chitinophaga sp. Cy-1792]|uniref:carboxymuconolactone decarboxylase family protein n=1 Tax=Chitinophaga sp. Cy-1792 TaxID=2608339 RepID=UPI00141F2BD2|nr:carboxymuconolactone decarboxylase family protein [Chitinophaga sp. Cy-1792]NIG54697.1 carboxymuconolactone decarboxylase family protein [Chitinophaga sp. Cy-1792]
MDQRININKIESEAYKGMYMLEQYLKTSNLTPIQIHLIKLRASQINGCAFCLNMHSKEALQLGETAQRIFVLSAWRETTLFTDAEQVILEMTEEITLISQHGLTEATYQKAKETFDEHTIAQIIMCIATINSWNRIAVSTHMELI